MSKLQEKSLQQQAEQHQRKIDGFQSVHYTIENQVKRIRTMDGDNPAPKLTALATEMLGSKKRDTAHNICLLSLNVRGIRCQITPKLVEAMCTGNQSSNKSMGPSPFSPFSCMALFDGTILHELDLSVIFKRKQDEEELTPAE